MKKVCTIKGCKTGADIGQKEQPQPVIETIHLTTYESEEIAQGILDQWSKVRYHGSIKRRSFHLSFLYNDYIYAIGGTDISEGKFNDVQRLQLSDSSLKRWEVITPSELQLEKAAFAAGVRHEGMYYLFGGQNVALHSLNRICKYNIDDNTFEYVLIENNPLPPIDSHTTCLYEKKILLFGGNSNALMLNDVFEYDIEQVTMVNLTKDLPNKSKPVPRSGHACVILGNSLYMYGGADKDGNYLSDLWKYNIADNNWTHIELVDKEKNPMGRTGHSMTVINDKIYLFGGMTKIIAETNELWLYEPISHPDSFIKIHDTLVEIDEEDLMKETSHDRGQSNRKLPLQPTKKKFRLLDRAEVERKTNPNFFCQYKETKKAVSKDTIEQVSLTPNQKLERTMTINAEARKANVQTMRNSNIYTIAQMDAIKANNQLSTVDRAILANEKVNIRGIPPVPRNGHTAHALGEKLLIFGGDRNKMAFNDLYVFSTSINIS